MNKYIQALTLVTQGMTEANIAIPIIFGAISGIAGIIHAITGTGPTLAELATMIQQQIAANDAAGQAEIARLQGLLTPTP